MSTPDDLRLRQIIPGAEVETPRGVCYLVGSGVPAVAVYGGHRLEDFLRLDGETVAALARDPALASLPMHETVFLDVETTGLAGGTGTPAFLVGIGFFESGAFRIEQYFLRRLSEEAALCEALGEKLQRFAGIISFNGRTFDLPLLETRFRMARQRPPLSQALHFDLLHAARRIWRTSLPGCALGALESGLLGVQRTEDVESWRIPSIYVDYLRTRDPHALRPVFTHNRHDLLSLVALAVRACQTYESGRARASGSSSTPVRTSGNELASLARLCEMNGEMAAAARLYVEALRENLAPALEMQALWRLGTVQKRLRAWEDALEAWELLFAKYPTAAASALLELAKYYEHQARDLARAHTYALRAARAATGPGGSEAMIAGVEYRLARLERRLQRAASAAVTGRSRSAGERLQRSSVPL